MDISTIEEFAYQAHQEIGRYRVTVILSPDKMMKDQYGFHDLSWESVLYGKAEIEKVPDNKRGVYAFAVCQESKVLPPHGYILYIGIAGEDSDRPLRDRYKDYFNIKKVLTRPGIARMIGDWRSVLRFYFAPVGDNVSSDELKTLEQQLNTALMPPFAERDLESDTKKKRKAFK